MVSIQRYIFCLLVLFVTVSAPVSVQAQESATDSVSNPVDVREIIFGHVLDSYGWHISKFGNKEVTIPLPIIIYSKLSGWHFFSSEKLEENEGEYEGLILAPVGSIYEGKLVEYDSQGKMVRPLDLSITKNVCSLFISCLLLLGIVLGMASWYKKHPDGKVSPGRFYGLMEMFIMWVYEDIIKTCIGPNYKKFAPYLLTVFFFILLNNLLGLVPIFPGGANVTGNLAITFVLALFTFIMVNVFGTKHYWKDIFWPDVPWWLKVPIPLMPLIELFGVFTKPLALMIRLFANILSGHISILVLTSMIFITASMGKVMNGSFTILSVLFDVFMDCLEVLVSFIQAYVFTLLSAVFIGLAQEVPEEKKKFVE